MNSATLPRTSTGSLLIPLGGLGAPIASISLASAGDMGFGEDANRSRRELWLLDNGFDPHGSAYADLVHSRRVVDAPSPRHSLGVQADGIIAPSPVPCEMRPDMTTCLVITVADCMPIFLYDSGTGAFGLLHSGWRGTGILSESIDAMKRLYGTHPKDVHASFGPRIGPCCYLVDEDRAASYSNEFGSECVSWVDGRPHIDLVAANLGIANRLRLGSVYVEQACTACDKRFGSFRRQGPERFTRMAVALGYKTGLNE